MKTYDVSFIKNEMYQSNLVETDKSPAEIEIWFKKNKPDKQVIGIRIATSDSFKPSKPIITIDEDYSQYYNKGNDCDVCRNQYRCGIDGDGTACRKHDDGEECEFVECEE